MSDVWSVELEHKAFRLEVRAEDIAANGEFTGYLSVFGNEDSYGDVVDKGAFTKTLSEQGATFPMLWQHDSAEPIGVMSGVQDDRGLFVKGALNMDVARAREAYALLKQGAIRGLSIGYVAVKWAMEGATRHLQEIKLYEGSVVTFPANELATVSHVKAAAELTAAASSLAAVLAEMKALLAEREPGSPTPPEPVAAADSGEPSPDTLAAVKHLLDDMRRVA